MESSTSEECSLCRDLEECTVSSRRKKAPLIIDLLESVDHSAPPPNFNTYCFEVVFFIYSFCFSSLLYRCAVQCWTYSSDMKKITCDCSKHAEIVLLLGSNMDKS